MKTNATIKCNNCGTEILVDDLLIKQFEPALRKKFQSESAELLEKARKSAKEEVRKESLLSIREKEKVIAELKTQLDEALRKANQGSVQRQGEIQELEIINILQALYVHDTISQSKKGVNAADILQIVKLQNGTECGKIYYESKNTRAWSNDWIPKLKQDNLKAKADILVLVSNVLPKGIEKYAIHEGVWVCSFNDIKELSTVLRFALIKLHAVSVVQTGKGNKMELLYSYLTSEEFKNVFESIIDGFKKLQDGHNSEKIKTQRMWKERELMLDQILVNSIEFYSEIRGIAGSVIPEVKMLETSTKVD